MDPARRIPAVLIALTLLSGASLALASPALAAEGDTSRAAYCTEVSGDGEGCPADQCPDLDGYQYSTDACPPVQPEPQPEPQPVDACPADDGLQADASQCLPEEAPLPVIETDATSLTIETVQHDAPATVGAEWVVPAAVAGASAAGTSAATTTPTGDLPYTGSPAILVAILAVSLLWLGGTAWLVGAAVSRRRA